MKAEWKVMPMGQLCSIKSGKSDTKDAVEHGPYAFFDRSRNVKRSSRYLYDCEALIIPGEGAEFLPKRFAGKFDLHQRAYALFDFSPQIDVRFLYYFLHHARDYFPRVAVGATVKSLRLRHFAQLPVSLTNVLEQRRIVGILDKAFAALATAKTNFEKNLQNARAFFDSLLHESFSNAQSTWPERKLEQAVSTGCSLSYGIVQPGGEYEKGLPVVRPKDLTLKVIALEGLKRIDPKLAEAYRRTKLVGGEILLCVRGETGGLSIASSELAGANVTRGIAPIQFDPNSVDGDFGFYLMSSEPVQRQIRAKTYGTALRQINIRDLRKLVLWFPPIHDQREIAQKLDKIHDKTAQLESTYAQKLARLEAVKESLLRRAFNGDLSRQAE